MIKHCSRILTLVAILALASGCSLLSGTDTTEQADATPEVLPSPTPLPSPPSARTSGLPAIAEIAAEVRPAVVFIATQELSLDFFLQPTQQEGAGSGVIFDAAGYVLTNNHVIENARYIRITLPDGRTFEDITLVGSDPLTDLAVLKIEGENLPVAKLGNSDSLQVGDWVVAIGNALGLDGGPTVTAGVVGAIGRSIRESSSATMDELIQTDAAINPGNSGGPLVNMNGEVVGINTAIDTRGQGIGFAISINLARPIIEELIKTGRIVRAFIGVNVMTLNPNVASQLGIEPRDGVVIVALTLSGPAAQAGLLIGDIVIAIDGEPVMTARDIQRTIRSKKPDEKIAVTLIRDNKEQTITVTLGELSGH